MYLAKISCDLLPIAICLLHDTSVVVDRAGFCLSSTKKHVFQTFHFTRLFRVSIQNLPGVNEPMRRLGTKGMVTQLFFAPF